MKRAGNELKAISKKPKLSHALQVERIETCALQSRCNLHNKIKVSNKSNINCSKQTNTRATNALLKKKEMNFYMDKSNLSSYFLKCKNKNKYVTQVSDALQVFFITHELYITIEDIKELMASCAIFHTPFAVQKLLMERIDTIAMKNLNCYQFVHERAIGGTHCSHKIPQSYIDHKFIVKLLCLILNVSVSDCQTIPPIVFTDSENQKIFDKLFEVLDGLFNEFRLYDNPFMLDELKQCVEENYIEKWNMSINGFLSIDAKFAFLRPLLIKSKAG